MGDLSHDTLTRAKKGGSSNRDPRKQIGFLYGPIKFSFVRSYQILPLVHQKLILSHLSINYDYAFTPSCKGLEVDFIVDHIIYACQSPNWS